MTSDCKMTEFANKVTELCLDKYASMKKSGKPTAKEWTVLAGIVLKDDSEQLSVVALATGTKCLSGEALININSMNRGSILSDSHAEILARRAFLRYFYHQIANILEYKSSDIFILDGEGHIVIKEGISFHFFSSQSPCGDCSIIPKDEVNSNYDGRPWKRIKVNEGDRESLEKEYGMIIKDLHRTGAKCVVNDERQDLHLPGINYHVVGPLRTKPGKGSRTLSLSCSDKMAKWLAVGIQGALLSLMIPILRLDSIIIGAGCPFSLESMERGLFKRFGMRSRVRIIQSSLAFNMRKSEYRTSPCPSSIIWSSILEKNSEVIVAGVKQGSTRKKPGDIPLFSRRAIFKTFLKIFSKYTKQKNLPRHPKRVTYHDCKEWSVNYQRKWREAENYIFRYWPSKSRELSDFIL